MKRCFLLAISLGILMTIPTCKKESCLCGIDNPQENLSWLKELIKNSGTSYYVYQFVVADTEYIEISDPPGTSDGASYIYNCKGEYLCMLGGFHPGSNFCVLTSSPEEFQPAYDRKKLVFITEFSLPHK